MPTGGSKWRLRIPCRRPGPESISSLRLPQCRSSDARWAVSSLCLNVPRSTSLAFLQKRSVTTPTFCSAPGIWFGEGNNTPELGKTPSDPWLSQERKCGGCRGGAGYPRIPAGWLSDIPNVSSSEKPLPGRQCPADLICRALSIVPHVWIQQNLLRVIHDNFHHSFLAHFAEVRLPF